MIRWLLTLLLFVAFTGCLPVKKVVNRGPLHLTDGTLLEGHHQWQGLVEITGLVRLPKGSTLSIEPGTRIIFHRIDKDGDGIGDSELLIEGSISAIGSPEKPIIFTSAEAEPSTKDWKYLYLDFAENAVFDYVVSEYAFSGIQIHFCKVKITNSVFRHNVDGVRFSTAKIDMSRSLIHHNQHGLRYEERGGSGTISENEISNNHIGIFAVTRSKSNTLITGNNIFFNFGYNVKMGLEQPDDLTFPANYWGTEDMQKLEQSFFDQKQDETLGKVIAPDLVRKFTDIPFSIKFKETFR